MYITHNQTPVVCACLNLVVKVWKISKKNKHSLNHTINCLSIINTYVLKLCIPWMIQQVENQSRIISNRSSGNINRILIYISLIFKHTNLGLSPKSCNNIQTAQHQTRFSPFSFCGWGPCKIKHNPSLPEAASNTLSWWKALMWWWHGYSAQGRGYFYPVYCILSQPQAGCQLNNPLGQVWMKWDGCKTICLQLTCVACWTPQQQACKSLCKE